MKNLARQNLKLIGSFVVLNILLSACGLGYSTQGGPYPYSHVNQKPTPSSTAEKPTPPAQAQNTSAPVPVVRSKPIVPVAQTVTVKTKPSQRNIEIQKGDTVYALSRRHGITVRSIITLNNLKAPYLLKPGQTLKIASGSTYVVKRGDTVYGVSRRNGILMNDLVRMNNLSQPYALNIGQTLTLPNNENTTSIAQADIAPPPQISGKGFMWPVNGKVLSGYGPKQAGYHNDGVNISAPLGSSVYASDSGVVVHASNKLEGYGNLILIKHQNGWVTAYAHTDKMLVTKGQQVSRGQVVAQVGQTGRVSSPQLHFEMRKGTRAVNPTHYLKS